MKAEVEASSLLQEVIRSRPNNRPFIIKLGNIDDLTEVQIPGHKKIMLKADRAVTLKCLSKSNEHKHLQVQRDASLTLEGQITLQGTNYKGNTQYALYVENGGKAEIKNGVTITSFKNGNIGPVVSAGNLIMSGGTITGNQAKNGGGVYIHASWGSFTMIGGTIEENTADKGGGVYSQGNFTMSGETITKNTATGHGKAVMLNYNFHWEGGEIKDNRGNGPVVGGSGGYFQNNCHGTAS